MSNGVVWTAVLVWLLVTLDGGFAGFRDAAGRSLHLDLRPMQVRNILRGLGGAQVVCLLSAVPLLVGAAAADTLRYTLRAVQTAGTLALGLVGGKLWSQ